MAHAYNIIIDCGVGAPGNVRKVVDGLNDTVKLFLLILTKTVELPDAAGYNSHMAINTSNFNIDISTTREFQKYFSDPTRKNGLMDQGKDIKWANKKNGLCVSIMFNTANLCHTHL